MASNFTRRQFATTAAAASLTTLLPRGVGGYASAAKKAVVHADQEIGTVRPEFHSHFAEHLGILRLWRACGSARSRRSRTSTAFAKRRSII